MIETLRRLSLGIVLIALSGAVLLYTDRGSRRSARGSRSADQPIRVALVQHASLVVLEDGADGVIEALAARGYQDGGRIRLKRFNAEGDLGTANTIAREVTGGSYDFVISLSTPSLQTVANANRSGSRTPHVFGLVTDPYGTGVGISATNHLQHPPHLTGYGSMQPVEDTLRIAKAMRPDLRRLGLVWNAAEANSLAQTIIGRRVCKDLGIELIEANADSSTAAVEAAASLLARGIEALWLSGDITVSTASEALVMTARRAGIPAFTCLPPNVQLGAIFDLGANYREVGRSVGQLAADVLDGRSPATIPVENFVPETFLVNETVLPSLKERWSFPPDIRAKATGWITATATNLPAPRMVKPAAPREVPPKAVPGRQYRIGLAYFAPEAGAELCMRGLFEGLKALGYEEGRNLTVQRTHAQGEIANIPAILQTLDSAEVDLIIPMTTPVISGACAMVKHKPVVLTYCFDPLAAGAGTSFTNHLPFMTGVGSFPPVPEMVDAIRRTLPGASLIGTLYNASEANSTKVVNLARGLFKSKDIELSEVTVGTSADVFQAAQALVSRGVRAFYIPGDNTVLQGFEAVVQVAQEARLPVFVDDPDTAKRGATACVGLGFYAPGFAAATPVGRVLNGDLPSGIPLVNVSDPVVWLDVPKASALGIRFPEDLLKAYGEFETMPRSVPAPNNAGSATRSN
ncbi:MAG: ABC transporter substrate-binding protein [Limisphaerales bacterium]